MTRRQSFDAWVTSLREDVVEGEFGYEPGEFTVYPDHWRPLWKEGLTPLQAFQRALDGFAAERRDREEQERLDWARVQAEDAKYREGP